LHVIHAFLSRCCIAVIISLPLLLSGLQAPESASLSHRICRIVSPQKKTPPPPTSITRATAP
jgi:hypothetical protein